MCDGGVQKIVSPLFLNIAITRQLISYPKKYKENVKCVVSLPVYCFWVRVSLS